MNKEQRMYVAVEERTDWIKIDGNESKFYPHPELKDVYVSRNGEVARKRIKSGKIMLVPTRQRNDGYVDCNVNDIASLVHVLVLETFVSRPDEEKDWVCDHINNRRHQNNIENLQWLTRTENLKKRDDAGSLNKETFVYDRVKDTLTKYDSRLEAADAIGIYVSNMVTAMKKEMVIRGRYFLTDADYMTSEDYYYIFKEVDLKNELKKAKAKKEQVILNKLQGIGA